MKFDIRNIIISGLLVVASCKQQGNHITSPYPTAPATKSETGAPTPAILPTTASLNLKGVLVFQQSGLLEAIQTGQKESVTLCGITVDGWSMSQDGTRLCFAAPPTDVDFFNAGAYRTYLFVARFNTKQRVLMAAYGPRAMPETYGYSNPHWAPQKNRIVVDEIPYFQDERDMQDSPCFSYVALYDSETRRRLWGSQKASQTLKPLTKFQRMDFMDGALSPDGRDLVCLARPSPCETSPQIKSMLPSLVHFDLKNKSAQVLDSFPIDNANIPALVWHPGKKCILYARYAPNMRGNVELFQFDLTKKTSTRLTNNESNDTSPQWSLDGKSILWVRDGQIYQANADGSNPTRILPQVAAVTQIQLLSQIADWSRYRKLSIEALAGQDK